MGMPTFQWEQSEIAMEKTHNQDDNTPAGLAANDNRVERAREFFRQSGKFLYLHDRVGEEDAVALLDAFAASETSTLTARLEAEQQTAEVLRGDIDKLRAENAELRAEVEGLYKARTFDYENRFPE